MLPNTNKPLRSKLLYLRIVTSNYASEIISGVCLAVVHVINNLYCVYGLLIYTDIRV